MPGTEVSFTSVKLVYKVLVALQHFHIHTDTCIRHHAFSPCGAWYQVSAFSQLTYHTGLVFWGGVSRSQAGLKVTVQPRITLNLNSSGFYLLTTNQATPSPSFLFIPLAATLPFFLPPLAGSLFPPNRSPLQLPSYTQSTSLQPHPIPLP